jgi:hypothetical protein
MANLEIGTFPKMNNNALLHLHLDLSRQKDLLNGWV